MDYSPGCSSPRQISILKRDYRILRSKVLKILDEKFFHPSKDVIQYEAKLAQVQTAFKKIKDREFLDNPQAQYKSPKTLDINFYNPTLKTLKYDKPEKTYKQMKDLETLTIDNLCKYLTPEEIDLICEDPIYFLGRKEYRVNPDLNDHKGWNRQLVYVKERKEREDNWKETMTQMRTTMQNSPRMQFYDTLSTRTLKTACSDDMDWKKEAKDSMLKIYARKVQAKNNQMQSLVSIRKMEESEMKRNKEYEWEFSLNDKCTKVLEKKVEAMNNKISEQRMQREQKMRKFEQKEKERKERNEILKIARQIDDCLKEKALKEHRKLDAQMKSLKARKMMHFSNRRRFFVTKIEEEKPNIDSENQSAGSHR